MIHFSFRYFTISSTSIYLTPYPLGQYLVIESVYFKAIYFFLLFLTVLESFPNSVDFLISNIAIKKNKKPFFILLRMFQLYSFSRWISSRDSKLSVGLFSASRCSFSFFGSRASRIVTISGSSQNGQSWSLTDSTYSKYSS